jgi:hypothetical protein
MNGKCLRLITERTYNNLKQSKFADVFIVPIHNELLSIMITGLDPFYIFGPETEEVVKKSLEYLKQLDLIKDDKPVVQATFLSLLKIGLRSAMVLYEYLFRSLKLHGKLMSRDHYVAIMIACLIDDDPRTYIYQDVETTFKPFLGRNDLETLINMWQNLLIALNFKIQVNYRSNLDQWCKIYKFKYDSMDQLIKSVNDCITIVNAHIYKTKESKESTKADKEFNPIGAAELSMSTEELNLAIQTIHDIYIDVIMTTKIVDKKGEQKVVFQLAGKKGPRNYLANEILPQKVQLDKMISGTKIIPLTYHMTGKEGQTIVVSSYVVVEQFSEEIVSEGEEESAIHKLSSFTTYDPSAFD